MLQSRPTRIYIEGNIGSGKTTFCKYLNEYYKDKDVNVVLEPLDRWLSTKDDNDKNILDLYYRDPAKYSFVFQMTTFITRCQGLLETESPVVISERSNFTDKNIFVKLCMENNHMSSIEETVYNEWFDWLVNKNNLEGDLFVYLKTDAEKCKQRIIRRGRVEETDIPLSLLESIERKHDEWLLNPNLDNKIVLDNNSDDDQYSEFAEIIDQYINDRLKMDTNIQW